MRQYRKIIAILKYLTRKKIVSSYDEELQTLLGVEQRQLARELKTLSEEIDNLKKIKIGKKDHYQLIKPIDILEKVFENEYELSILFDMAQEFMPEVFKEWNKISKVQNKPYMFFNMPYEDIKEMEKNKNFILIKEAIINKKNINFEIEDGNKEKSFINVSPIKILFSEGNWYIAFVKEENLIIRRIQFIKHVEVVIREKEINIDKYIKWLEEKYQNPFTLYNKEFKKATLLAKNEVSLYFKPHMKQYFKTQKFIKETSKGVIFSIEYTQPIELFPFLQKWLPNIEILEPIELKEEFKKRILLFCNNS